jgi:hypothetical protein
MNIPGFTAESSLYNAGRCYSVVTSAINTVGPQLVNPAFPWGRCLGGCLGCLLGDELACVFCRNCAICLFDLKPCPDVWRKL